MRKTLSKKEVKEIFKRINRSIKDDIEPSVKRKKGGYFAVPRFVFAQVDFLGGLYTNRTNESTKNATKFINRYFVQTNKYYKILGELVYIMYRHGTIHEYQPKILKLKNGPLLVSAMGKKRDKFTLEFQGVFIPQQHLKLKQYLFRDLYKYINDPDFSLPGRYVSYWVPISLTSLLEELNEAIKLFEQDVLQRWYLRKRFSDEIKRLKTPQELKKQGASGKVAEKKVQQFLAKLFRT